jgi:hypothetical protein
MALLDLLPTSTLGLQGITPPLSLNADPASTLHYQSSINNDPLLPNTSPPYPPPSTLDRNGATPPSLPDGDLNSSLHYQSSINNDPTLDPNLPPPSQLDLGGIPPSVSPTGQGLPYINNLPG